MTRLKFGVCGHYYCLQCSVSSVQHSLLDFLGQGGCPANAYVAPEKALKAPPGLLCPVCAPSKEKKEEFAVAHWKKCTELRQKAKAGVTWRLSVDDPNSTWACSFYGCKCRGKCSDPATGCQGKGELLFRVMDPASFAGQAREAGAGSEHALSIALPPGEDTLNELDVALAEDGFHVYRLRQGAQEPTQIGVMAHPFAPAPRRVSFTGAAKFGTAPRPPSSLPGFVTQAALARMAAYAAWAADNQPALRVKRFSPDALAKAEQAITMMTVYLASLARPHSNAPYGGALVASLRGAGGGSSPLGGGGGGTTGGGSSAGGVECCSDVPTSPTLAAPLCCPHEGCGAVLSVDLPPSHEASRAAHLTCVSCSRSLCGACGLPWTFSGGGGGGAGGGGSSAVTHAGYSCKQFGLMYARLTLEDVTAEDSGLSREAREAVKRCPMPHCNAIIFRYRGHACHTVTCGKCNTSLCYCCLATNTERSMPWHNGCPGYCEFLPPSPPPSLSLLLLLLLAFLPPSCVCVCVNDAVISGPMPQNY